MFPRIRFSRWLIGGMILALLLISGCTAPTLTPTYTPTPTATVTPTPTETPTPTAIPTPEGFVLPPEFYPEWIKSEVKIEGIDEGFWVDRTRSGTYIDAKYADVLAKQIVDWDNLPESVEVIGIEIYTKALTGWTIDAYFYNNGQWERVDFDSANYTIPRISATNKLTREDWYEWLALERKVKKQTLHLSGDPKAVVAQITLYDSQTNTYYVVEMGIVNGVAKPIFVGFVSTKKE